MQLPDLAETKQTAVLQCSARSGQQKHTVSLMSLDEKSKESRVNVVCVIFSTHHDALIIKA